MPNLYLLVFAALLIGVALGASASQLWNYRRRLHALERKLTDLEKVDCRKNDVKHLARRDVGEAVLFDYARLRDELNAMQAWLEFSTRRAQHVARGGSPDDPPTKWAQ